MATTHKRDGKHPLTPVAGPYGHPFHAAAVTIPIGAWICSFVFDIVSRSAENPEIYGRGAYWLIAIGIVGAVGAALLGVLDLLTIPRGTKAFRTGLLHAGINDVVLAAFVVSFFIRRSDGDWGETSVGLIVLSGAALALLTVSGWLGGKLAYRYGVRVAHEADQAEGLVGAGVLAEGQRAEGITRQ
jgi:uncharacterized membrane protein